MGMVGAAESVRGVGCQAAVAAPVTWFQVVNRSVIARRYSWAESRCRPGRKCGELPLKADKNRWACRAEVNLFISRSRCRVGRWEFSAWSFRYLDGIVALSDLPTGAGHAAA